MHFVLKHWFIMVGVDLHVPWAPGAPAPAPLPVPYQTSFLLMGIAPKVFSQPLFSHMTDGFAITMAQGTDIGSLIPHLGPPSLTLPVEIALSSSVSHFGAARYQAEGRTMACAVLGPANLNLNCGTPAPTPTGIVMGYTTHVVDMTLADLLGGLAAMCADIALQWALTKIGGRAGSAITRAIMRRVRTRTWNTTFFRCMRMFKSTRLTYAERYRAAAFRATEDVLREWRRTGRMADTAVGVFLGGPMGADAGTLGGPTPGGWASDRIGEAGREGGEAIGEWLRPPAAITDYNSGPGAPASIN